MFYIEAGCQKTAGFFFTHIKKGCRKPSGNNEYFLNFKNNPGSNSLAKVLMKARIPEGKNES